MTISKGAHALYLLAICLALITGALLDRMVEKISAVKPKGAYELDLVRNWVRLKAAVYAGSSPVNNCDLWANYHTAKIVVKEVMEDPTRRMPLLGASVAELRDVQQSAAMALAENLTRSLRDKKANPRWGCDTFLMFLGGRKIAAPLYVQRHAYDVAVILKEVEAEIGYNPKFRADKLASAAEIRLAISRHARHEAPELIARAWAGTGEFGWSDSAGALYNYLVDEKIAPQTLGLSTAQTAALLNANGIF